MRCHSRIVVDQQAGRGADQAALDLDAKLARGKRSDLAQEFFPGPGRDALQGFALHPLDRLEIALTQAAYDNLAFMLAKRARTHEFSALSVDFQGVQHRSNTPVWQTAGCRGSRFPGIAAATIRRKHEQAT